MSNHSLEQHKVCCFCGLSEDNEIKFGKFYEHDGVVTHYYCLLLSSNMEQNGNDNEGILGFLACDVQKEIRRGKRLACSYCKKSGATLGCCNTKCKKIFHYPCGLRAGSLHQFFGEFRSYCLHHRPKQKIDDHVKRQLKKTDEVLCYICYDNVDPHNFIETLWAPCCKKNAWFHRGCIEQLAMSAGYFFKCPLCNNKMEFQEAMLQYGIFIPSQDASWELEPNAFQELLYRHDHCDAPECLCPKGRKYTSSNAKWELALCRTCGSQGIHMECGHLKWANPVWECAECISILYKSKDSTSSDTTMTLQQNVLNGNVSRNDSDSDDSDTDISVGKESPVPFASCTLNTDKVQDALIKLRPGPRSYKLRQLRHAAYVKQLNEEKEECSTEEKNLTIDETNRSAVSSTRKSRSSAESITRCNAPDKDVIMIDSEDEDLEIISQKAPKKKVRRTRHSTCELRKVSHINAELATKNLPGAEDPTKTVDKSNSITSVSELNNSNQQVCDYSAMTSFARIDSEIEEELNIEHDKSENNRTSLSPNTNLVSDIKIANIASLSPEMFANISNSESILRAESALKLKHQVTASNFVQILESDDILHNASSSLSTTSQSKIADIQLKRKSDNVYLIDKTSGFTPAYSDKFKKIRHEFDSNVKHHTASAVQILQSNSDSHFQTNVENNQHLLLKAQEQNEKVFHIDLNNFDKSNEISYYTTMNSSEAREDQYNKIKKGCIRTVDEIATKINHNFTKDKNNYVANDSENQTLDCDGGAGTSPAVERGRNGSKHGVCMAHETRQLFGGSNSNSQAERVQGTACPETSSNKPSTVFPQVTNNRNACDRLRLIPESVALRDLKFCVQDSNNLQMILYDTFFVNINMDKAMKKNAKLDLATRKTPPTKIPKQHSDAFSSTKRVQFVNEISSIPSESNKEKFEDIEHTNERNMHIDETKRKLRSQITVFDKNISSGSNMDGTPQGNNQVRRKRTIKRYKQASPNLDNTNQSSFNEERGLMEDDVSAHEGRNRKEYPFDYSKSIGIDINNECCNHGKPDNAERDLNVPNTRNIKQTLKDTYVHKKSAKDVTVKHSLRSNHVSSSTPDQYNNKEYTEALAMRDTTNITLVRSKNMSGTSFKVSVDLSKIRNLIDTNPDLFMKHNMLIEIADKQNHVRSDHLLEHDEKLIKRLRTRHVMKSAVTEMKNHGSLRLSSSGTNMTHVIDSANDTVEELENKLPVIRNSMQETRVTDNTSIINQKQVIKGTKKHLDQQRMLNR